MGDFNRKEGKSRDKRETPLLRKSDLEEPSGTLLDILSATEEEGGVGEVLLKLCRGVEEEKIVERPIEAILGLDQ